MGKIFDSEPVSLPHLRMVKRFAEHLEPLGENGRLPEEYHSVWAGYFQECDMTMAEADQIGKWYAKHHTIGPSIPGVMNGLKFLRKHRSMPSQRLATDTELLAGDLLQLLSERGTELHEAARALILASALAQGAYYRKAAPMTGRDDITNEFEGLARQADFFADDILNEVQQGWGSLAGLESYLFENDEIFDR